MGKKIKGFIKPCGSDGTAKTGYQALWDTGRARSRKLKGKISGTNRPSV